MISLKEKIEMMEKEEIVLALQECGWVKARAAKMLGITERMISYKIKKYCIKKGGDEGYGRWQRVDSG
jgi:Nif-specific regulatory protein